jgi:hypothetical protein
MLMNRLQHLSFEPFEFAYLSHPVLFMQNVQVLAAEVVALEEARVAARAAELRASAAARDAAEEARAARTQAAKLSGERQSLAAAVGSLQVRTPYSNGGHLSNTRLPVICVALYLATRHHNVWC